MRGKHQKKRRHRRLPKGLIRLLAAVCAAAAVSCVLINDLSALVPDEKEISAEELKETGIQIQLNKSSRHLDRSRVFAHRGFCDNAPDNSFGSFDAAIAAGCPQIELDVRASTDGILYVSHDDKITGPLGTSVLISESDSAALDACQLANGEKLHRLSELFERYGTDMIYLVEFKNTSLNADVFYDLLHEYPEVAEKIQAQSFYPDTLLTIHETFPNMYIQALVNKAENIDWMAQLDFIDGMAIKYPLITQEIIDYVHDQNLEVWAWTVDTVEDIQKLDEMGIDGVITNMSSALQIISEKS